MHNQYIIQHFYDYYLQLMQMTILYQIYHNQIEMSISGMNKKAKFICLRKNYLMNLQKNITQLTYAQPQKIPLHLHAIQTSINMIAIYNQCPQDSRDDQRKMLLNYSLKTSIHKQQSNIKQNLSQYAFMTHSRRANSIQSYRTAPKKKIEMTVHTKRSLTAPKQRKDHYLSVVSRLPGLGNNYNTRPKQQ